MRTAKDLKFVYLCILDRVIRTGYTKLLSLILQLADINQFNVPVRLFLKHKSNVVLCDISGFRVWLRFIQGQAKSESLEGGPEHRYLKASGFDKFIKLFANNDVS